MRAYVTVILAAWIGVLLSTPIAFGQEGGTARTEPEVSVAEDMLLRQVLDRERTDRRGAISLLQAQITPSCSAALDYTLGVLLAREGRHAQAERCYLTAVRKLPEFARAWGALGRLRVALDRPREAAAALGKAIGNGRGSAENWRLLGTCHLLAERPDLAVTAFRRSLTLDPEDRRAERGLAQALFDAHRYLEAIPLLRERCDRDPRDRDAWLLLAQARLALEDSEGALEVLETARRLVTLDAASLLALGDLCYQQGLYRLAAARYGEAFPEGEDAERLLNCAEALAALSRNEEAEEMLGKAMKGKLARPARAHLLAARIASARDDAEAAEAACRAALEADPLSGEAMLELGRLLLARGERERARVVLERATRAPGVSGAALVLLAQVEVDLGEYASAVTRLEEALEIRASPRIERYLEQIRRIARLRERE